MILYRYTIRSCYDVLMVDGFGSTLASTPDAQQAPPEFDLLHLRRLAEFRYQLRRFLHISQIAIEEAGLRPQQYLMLQCVATVSPGAEPTIANVAERMFLKHNSTVELVDRTIEQGLLRRTQDEADHRRILLRITPQGKQVLASLGEFHTRQLEQAGPELVRALARVLKKRSHPSQQRDGER